MLNKVISWGLVDTSKNKLIQEIKEKLKNEIIKITSPDIEV